MCSSARYLWPRLRLQTLSFDSSRLQGSQSLVSLFLVLPFLSAGPSLPLVFEMPSHLLVYSELVYLRIKHFIFNLCVHGYMISSYSPGVRGSGKALPFRGVVVGDCMAPDGGPCSSGAAFLLFLTPFGFGPMVSGFVEKLGSVEKFRNFSCNFPVSSSGIPDFQFRIRIIHVTKQLVFDDSNDSKDQLYCHMSL